MLALLGWPQPSCWQPRPSQRLPRPPCLRLPTQPPQRQLLRHPPAPMPPCLQQHQWQLMQQQPQHLPLSEMRPRTWLQWVTPPTFVPFWGTCLRRAPPDFASSLPRKPPLGKRLASNRAFRVQASQKSKWRTGMRGLLRRPPRPRRALIPPSLLLASARTSLQTPRPRVVGRRGRL